MIRLAFNAMLKDLQRNCLEVVLIPAPHQAYTGHQIRAVVGANPVWYREICSRYLSARKDQNKKGRTKIKRKDIKKILRKLADGVSTTSVYLSDLTEAAETLIHEWREE